VPFEDPQGRIEDILDAVEKFERYTRGMTLEEFTADDWTVDAVVRNLITIGEAARHVPDLVAKYPGLPWHQMRGLRNIAVHEYAQVETHIIWDTATRHLPLLVPGLREILERERALGG
jgi:uncharacterized protein with HEPN domain